MNEGQPTTRHHFLDAALWFVLPLPLLAVGFGWLGWAMWRETPAPLRSAPGTPLVA